MNPSIHTIASYLEQAALTAPLFDTLLKSIIILAMAAGLCLLLPRAAAATRHWALFVGMASLPCLLLLSAVPQAWHKPLWSVSTDLESGNQVSLTLNLAPAGGVRAAVTPGSPARRQAATAASHAAANGERTIAARLSAEWLAVALVI